MKSVYNERFEEKYDGISKSKGIPNVTITLEKRKINEKIMNRVTKECQTPFFYHKFIIYGAESYERNYILKSIMDFVYPATLMPIHFQQIVGLSYFLARNCLDIITKIAKENFQIPHHLDTKAPFNVVVLANFMVSEEVPLQDTSNNIEEVLQKRFKRESRILNLNNFSDDVDLIEYFPLFNDKIFRYVINQSAGLAPRNLDLANNYLKDISSLSILKGCVETLDLSNNELKDIESLSKLSEFTLLKHLMLTGNPLCENYNSYNYVIDVKRYCSKLETLDGVDVRVPRFEKNFLCCEDARDLASQFLERYFTNYDSDRMLLKDMYDSSVIFSMNASVHSNQKNSDSVRLEHYGLGKPDTTCGITEVMKLFQQFPKTWHDPYPLVCDVVIFTDTRAHLVVNGIFKELNQMLFFNRSFYFSRNSQRFTITNEQLHVSNAIDYQVSWSFTFPGNVHLTSTPLPYFYQQYRQLEELFCTLTNVNLEYAQKCLLYSNYDLRKALSVFSELFLKDGVPKEAFTKQRKLENQKNKFPICNGLRERVLEKHKTISLKVLWETMETARFETNTDSSTDYKLNKFYKSSMDTNVNITHVKKEEFNKSTVGVFDKTSNIKREEQDITVVSPQKQAAKKPKVQYWISPEETKKFAEKLSFCIESLLAKSKQNTSIIETTAATSTSVGDSSQEPSSNPPTTIIPSPVVEIPDLPSTPLPQAPLNDEQAQEISSEQSAIITLDQTIKNLCWESPVQDKPLVRALVHKRMLEERRIMRTGALEELEKLDKMDEYCALQLFSKRSQRKFWRITVNRKTKIVKAHMEKCGSTLEEALYHTFDKYSFAPNGRFRVRNEISVFTNGVKVSAGTSSISYVKPSLAKVKSEQGIIVEECHGKKGSGKKKNARKKQKQRLLKK
ncbi:unnamed protein product [Phyllotreta striolata]|uniref:NTF2 domain-containing protein n=1 Tax=Phyllotreta striolata TaxID=444603 RepID=A0A9N9TLC9_PHYSR|nr:unnamed protein product [Phyllotreta striolata]